MLMRVLIVDDEALARARMRALLTELSSPAIEIAGELADGRAAVEFCARERVHAVLLDISMPVMDGLEAARHLAGFEIPPAVIFCTAYDEHALAAFEARAVDYLVKPVVPERLARTLDRVRPRQHSGAPVYLPNDHGLLLKFGECARIVRLHDINRFQSIGNHAAVYTAHGRSFLLSSLNRIEQRLDPAHFFRVSRSDILRLDAIQRFELDIGLIAYLVDGSAVAVSRRQAQVLKVQMGGL